MDVSLSYRLPGSTKVWKVSLCKAEYNTHENYFVRKNFWEKSSLKFYKLIHQQPYEFINNTIIPVGVALKSNMNQHEYFFRVNQLINIIRSEENKINKVVFARQFTLEVSWNFSLKQSYFEQLLLAYPNAFVYWFESHNETWMGATPETLFTIKNENFYTMSLAGTRQNNNGKPNEPWTDKEYTEQQIVTNYLKENLKKLKFKNVFVTKPKNHLAGNLIHLKTEINATPVTNYEIKKLINKLHPTPAVGGYPKQNALTVLKNIENTNRQWYAGVIGFTQNLNTNLFVNLRCMQIIKNKTHIFAGGGITSQSVAEHEWNETENKLNTLLQFFQLIDEV